VVGGQLSVPHATEEMFGRGDEEMFGAWTFFCVFLHIFFVFHYSIIRAFIFYSFSPFPDSVLAAMGAGRQPAGGLREDHRAGDGVREPHPLLRGDVPLRRPPRPRHDGLPA